MANVKTKEYPFVNLGIFKEINCADTNKISVCSVKFSSGNLILSEKELKNIVAHYKAIDIEK